MRIRKFYDNLFVPHQTLELTTILTQTKIKSVNYQSCCFIEKFIPATAYIICPTAIPLSTFNFQLFFKRTLFYYI